MRHIANAVQPARLSTLWSAAALLAIGLVVSGCEVTETSGGYQPGPMCPRNYDPVCAERRGEVQTFPNACEARRSDWRIVSNGQCRGPGIGDYRPDRPDRDRDGRNRDRRNRDNEMSRDPRYDRPDRPDRNDRNRPDRPGMSERPTRPGYNGPAQRPNQQGGCPAIVDPVCGQLGNDAVRFPNRCEMQRSGAVEVDGRQCGRRRP